jgi:hypothetical protein
VTPPDFCARCGNYFPDLQVCDPCRTDAERVRAAADVLRRRNVKETFMAGVLIRTLDRYARQLDREIK